MRIRHHLFIVLLAFALLAFVAPQAMAQTAEELRSSGAAGERWDGLMEARDPSARAAVEAINRQRLSVYRQRASEQNVPVEEVGKVYFEQLLSRVPRGTWIKRPDGTWVQR